MMFLFVILIAFCSGYGCRYYQEKSRKIDREMAEIAKKTVEQVWFEEYK